MAASSLESSLLIAMPQLEDPNFRRAVVLLIHQDEDGTFGLVVNRPAGITALELCENLGVPWNGDPNATVGGGGPVQQNTGWVLFGDEVAAEFEDASEVVAGLNFASSLHALQSIAANPPDRVRLFLGYAGWGPGQLESELAQGAWLLAPANPELVFAVPDEEKWSRVLHDLGIDPATLVATPGIH